MATEIKVPTLGESLTEGTVANWLKSIGDSVAIDEPILELETDKVTMEVNAPIAGTLIEIVAGEGEEVEVGTTLGLIGDAGDATTPTNNQEAALVVSDGTVTDVIVPVLGESLTEGTVANWLKSVGDAVGLDEPLLELETDKVTIEVNAPNSGHLIEILAGVGDEVEVGAVLGRLGSAGKTENSSPVRSEPEPTKVVSAENIQMSPAVRKIIEDQGYDATKISATGKDGRLTKGDILAFQRGEGGSAISEPATKAVLPSFDTQNSNAARTQIPSLPAGPREERIKMTRLRKVIAGRLKDAQNTAAMLTTFNEVDMSAVMEARSEFQEKFEKIHGVRLGFMSYFVKAAIVALKEFPAVNAEIQGDEIVYKNYYNIGVAVGTPTGLVVPVLKNADQMSFADIEKSIKDFGRRARDGQLSLDEMTSGSFTITNGGIYGSMLSTPIINAPQSGILGMHNIVKRPWVVGQDIKIRPVMYLAHSYDHRIIDGREAVSMLVRIKECIENPQRIMLDM
ncbi:2-oxoglutarate dehydrogenase complex dihydrolipoyllysine-residue succinyltransferase [Gammaproteobacteria bacterium]|nr:2-oxoglutarate dehydrogenase complex dihydrolipoyllysine-residue succinyltransferase [Gammaproteobacteria bacterium]